MGEAFLSGLIAAGVAADSLAVAEAHPERRHDLEVLFPGVRVVPSAAWAVADAEVIVVAVKPPDVVSVLASIEEAITASATVISIAAGISTVAIESATGKRSVIRVMPNTPAMVGAGVSAIAAGSFATEADLAEAERLLRALGTTVRVDEDQIDAVTAISGSGPAYVFLVAEAMIDAGVAEGLDRELAAELVFQTILGAGQMLVQTNQSAKELRAMVTSPGGTTAAAIAVFQDEGFESLIADAVHAARVRSEEMGR